MLKKYAQMLLDPNTDNSGGNIALADNNNNPQDITPDVDPIDNALLKGLSLDEEILKFEGPRRFQTPEDKQDKATKSEGDNGGDDNKGEGKVEDNKVKPVTNVKDFAKIMPNADNVAKKLGATDKDGDKGGDNNTDDNNNNNAVNQRDVSQFSEQEQKFLKRMSNAAFDYVSKQLLDKRELEAKYTAEKTEYEAKIKKLSEGRTILPDSYYDHPQAAMLSPEVQELQQTISNAAAYENHWKQQLMNIESGKDWFDLVEDPKTGRVYMAAKATPAGAIGSEEWIKNKFAVTDYYNQTQRQTLGLQQQLNTYVAGFKTRHDGLLKSIQQAEDTYMPMFKDPKSEEYKKVEEVGKAVTALGINPSNPVHRMLSKSIALNLLLKDAVMSMQQEFKKGEQVKAQQTKAGPTSASFSGGSGGKGEGNTGKTISLSDFEGMGLKSIKF